MKVLHINFSDKRGGAAIAAYRHHEAMLRRGIDSKMLVLDKTSNDPDVMVIQTNSFRRFVLRCINKLFMLKNNFYSVWSWGMLGWDIAANKEIREADVIILHWINGVTLSIKSIDKILQSGKPVYWFMHDMWPITGGCHHSLDCDKFKRHCGRCPLYHNRHGSRMQKDASYFQFKSKMKRLGSHRNLRFMAPSAWLAGKTMESALFKTHEVRVVRNVIDTKRYRPIDKTESRQRLGLPLDKKLILFGADNINSPYKGWDYLRDALQSPIKGVECVVYGNADVDVQSQLALKTHSLGRINNEENLIDLYNACDVFVSPSLADNYPNVLVEAMACGLPVVAFPTGGIVEIVNPGVNGILTSSHSASELRKALMKIPNMPPQQYMEWSVNARRSVVQTNDYSVVDWFDYES